MPSTEDDGLDRERWSFRATDIDRLGHVNNAAYWVAVEDRWSDRLRGPVRAALEYRQPIDLGEPVELLEGSETLWLVVGEEIRAAAGVYPATP